jgi:hypothetical protein
LQAQSPSQDTGKIDKNSQSMLCPISEQVGKDKRFFRQRSLLSLLAQEQERP